MHVKIDLLPRGQNVLVRVSATTFPSWAINNTTAKNMTLSWAISNTSAKNDTLSFFREKFGLGGEIVCCRPVSHDESEPALTSAPVGHSVHRMGCVFSPSA